MLLASLVLSLSVIQPSAAAQQTIHYTVRFPAPQTNYVEVEADVPTDGRAALDMMMPVWTPGSYLVREYERNVENVAATAGGRSLSIDKTRKNRWRIETGGARDVRITYRVYSHEMSVRNNWVDADFALLNGAQTFMTVAGELAHPADVQVDLPASWKTSVSGLPAAPGGGANHYLAADYDTLVDSPIVAGNPTIHEFTVMGKPHYLVDVGEDGVFDGDRAARDVQKIVETEAALWGSLPYDKYVFFNVLTGPGGGLEHKNSVMMMERRWSTRTRSGYAGWLHTAAHEFFHLWNVKRLRPIELGPFDYERENYPRSLWFSEGVTDYYAGVMLARAGLITPTEYLALMSRTVKSEQERPGRLVQTTEMASYDAWIKQYRPDENTLNTSVDYYTKGALVGFLLDARIRAATNGAKSLDDLMRRMLARYSGAHGFTPQDLRRTASEIAGTDLSAWFHTVLDTTAELDYRPALAYYGLSFKEPHAATEASGWLGARTRNDAGRLVVSMVPRGTPAYEAGINPGDEILAIGDFRVQADQLDDRLKDYRPGDKVTVLVARREELKRLDVTLGEQPADTWELAVRPDASADERGRFERLLSSRS